MTARLRRVLVTFAAGLMILPLSTDAIAVGPPRLRIEAAVSCLPQGGLSIDLTFENRGGRTARIDPDFHLLIEPIRSGGRQPGVVLFVFPVPEFARIPPGESRTFVLTAGEPFEGEPAIDFSGKRILIELEVWVLHRQHPIVRTMSYPACGPVGDA